MPPPRSPSRVLPAWARRPVLPVVLLSIAVAVSVAHGQPPPADRASGVSVPVRTATPAPPPAGTLLMVAGGGVLRFDTDTRRRVLEPLPAGVAGLRVWTVGGLDVALGRLPYRAVLRRLPADDQPGATDPPAGLAGSAAGNPTVGQPGTDQSTDQSGTDQSGTDQSGTDQAAAGQATGQPAQDRTSRTGAWLVHPGRPAVSLGPAEAVVPSADGRTVWLVHAGTATRVRLRPGQRPATVPLPRWSRLVADTPAGLVVTTGTVPGPGQRTPAPHPTTTTATPSPTAATPSGQAAGQDGARLDAATEPRALPVTGTPADTTTGRAGGAGTPSTTDPTVVPLATMLIPRRGGPVRELVEAEAMAGYGDTVLVRRVDGRLGVVSLRFGLARMPRWLPTLSAVEVTGPAAIDYDGATFAVLARVNEHARLMVGPVNATSEADIRVVALEGGPPDPATPPPSFTASGRVLVIRPDGKVVYYLPGSRQGLLLGDDLPTAAAVVQG